MTKITNEMVSAAYAIGKEVYFRKLDPSSGIKQLTNTEEMGSTSAQNYIYVLLSMLNGTCYKRTINEFATEYYLSHIGLDLGVERQQNAARAALQHVEYYKGIHGYLKGIEEIAKKYLCC